MEDINFEIISFKQSYGTVIIKMRIEETFEKYHELSMSLNRFNSMEKEELEFEMYKIARMKVESYRTSFTNVNTKIEELKNSINDYNKKVVEKNVNN